MIKSLRDGDDAAREKAVAALAKIGAPAVEPLITLLHDYRTVADYDANVNPHHWAEEALIKIDIAAVEPLLRALQAEAWGARAGAVYCLGEIADVRAVLPLIDALHYEDIGWHEVCEALQKIGAVTVVRPLIFALKNNESAEVRWKAARTLSTFRDPMVLPALIRALDDDEDTNVRETIIYSLREFKDARAIEPLIAVLEDADPGVREAAVRALGETASALGSARAVEAFKGLLHDTDWGVRQSAAEMLNRLKADEHHEAEKLLLSDLQNDDAEVRLGAAWSLAELGDTRALNSLARLLYHNDNRISASAARALGKLGDQRAAAPLNTALAHQEAEVRSAAQEALRQLGYEV